MLGNGRIFAEKTTQPNLGACCLHRPKKKFGVYIPEFSRIVQIILQNDQYTTNGPKTNSLPLENGGKGRRSFAFGAIWAFVHRLFQLILGMFYSITVSIIRFTKYFQPKRGFPHYCLFESHISLNENSIDLTSIAPGPCHYIKSSKNKSHIQLTLADCYPPGIQYISHQRGNIRKMIIFKNAC